MFFPTKKIILFPSCFLSFFLFFCFPSLSSYVSGEVARHTGKSAFNFGVVQPIHRPLLIIHICVAGTVSRAEGACVLSCFSCVWLFVTPWTAAHQAPLPMAFPRQEDWSGLPFFHPGDLPDPGIEPVSHTSPALALSGRFFTTRTTWEAPINIIERHFKENKYGKIKGQSSILDIQRKTSFWCHHHGVFKILNSW